MRRLNRLQDKLNQFYEELNLSHLIVEANTKHEKHDHKAKNEEKKQDDVKKKAIAVQSAKTVDPKKLTFMQRKVDVSSFLILNILKVF